MNIGDDPTSRTADVNRGTASLGRDQMLLIFRSSNLTNDDTLYRATRNSAINALRTQPGVIAVTSLPLPTNNVSEYWSFGPYSMRGQPYSDQHNAYALVGLSGNNAAQASALPKQRAKVENVVQKVAGNSVEVFLVGVSAIAEETRYSQIEDVRIVEGIALLFSFVVLLLGLGSLRAALLPVFMAIVTVLISVGVFAVLSYTLSFDTTVITVTSMVGVGVGVDYSLLILSRYRDELANGAEKEHAVGVAIDSAGRTVLCSGILAATCGLSLFIVQVPIFREFALASFVTICAGMAAALTLLPAVIVFCGPRLQHRRFFFYEPEISDNGVWARWARRVTNKPWPYILISSFLIVACALPALNLQLGYYFDRKPIAHTATGRGLNVLHHDGFEGALGVVNILIDKGSAKNFAATVADHLSADRDVSAIFSVDAPNSTLLMVVPRKPPESSDTAKLVHRIGSLKSHHKDRIVSISGIPSRFVAVQSEVSTKTPLVIAVVLLFSFLCLTVIFNSILIPLKAVITNILAVGAGYGALVAAFQWGWGSFLLGDVHTGKIQPYIPLLMFALLFGLSLDYEVFLVRRMHEIFKNTADSRSSIVAGVQRTAHPITLAALILISACFGAFASHALEIRQLGFALMVSIAVDATVIRLVLVPALMQVLGRWNWWVPWRRE